MPVMSLPSSCPETSILLGSSDYPRGLCGLEAPPVELRVLGRLPSLTRSVAIVGTRHADEEAMDFTYELASSLARAGWVVVSGGALGIDRAAHEGALDAGGQTVVVLASGFDPPYPSENAELFARAAREGCLLTEQPDGTSPRPGRFLQRNRIVAGLAGATVVTQAPARSGALSTARHAGSLSRPVFATPASPWDSRSAGNLTLLLQGARVCVNANDVLSEVTPRPDRPAQGLPSRPRKASEFESLTVQEAQILRSLGGRARHPDELCRQSGIPASEAQRTILSLLVRGLIEERPGGRYRSCRRTRRH